MDPAASALDRHTDLHPPDPFAPPPPRTEAARQSLLHNTRELIDLLSSRVVKDRDAVEEYILLGRLFRLQGEPKRALKLHRNLLARPVLDRHLELLLLSELGMDMLEARAGDLGEYYFQKALKLQKQHVPALEGLARLHEAREEYDRAAEILARLVKLGRPEKTHLAFVYAEVAVAHLAARQIWRARRAVNRALRSDESCMYAHLVLADIFAEAARIDSAIKVLKSFLLRWPSHSFLALRRLEDAHYRKNAFPAYEDTLRDLLRLAPENYYLWYSLARHLRKKRRRDEALEVLRGTLEVSPFYINAVRDRMEMLCEKANLSGLLTETHRFFTALKGTRRFICPNCRSRFVPVTWHCSLCGTWGVFDIRYEMLAP